MLLYSVLLCMLDTRWCEWCVICTSQYGTSMPGIGDVSDGIINIGSCSPAQHKHAPPAALDAVERFLCREKWPRTACKDKLRSMWPPNAVNCLRLVGHLSHSR